MARAREHDDVSATPGTVRADGEPTVPPGRAARVGTGLPRSEARDRFGGVDPMAVLSGTMAAVGTLVLLSALAGALGRVGYEQGTGEDTLSTAALAAGFVLLGLALLLGGYVAGRVARYEGKRNGLLTGLSFAVLSTLVAAAASQADRVRDLGLPRFVDTSDLGVASLASAVTGLIVALGAAVLGGRYGAAYHRRVDDALLGPAGAGQAAAAPTPR